MVVGFATKEAVILEEELSQVAHVTAGTTGTMGLMALKAMSQQLLIRWTRSLTLSILVEHLACSNMSIPNFMTIPVPTFPWNRVWLVGWGLATPV